MCLLTNRVTEYFYFQIIKGYSNAILKIIGIKIVEEEGFGMYILTLSSKEYNIKVSSVNRIDVQIFIIEMVPVIQEVTANDIRWFE